MEFHSGPDYQMNKPGVVALAPMNKRSHVPSLGTSNFKRSYLSKIGLDSGTKKILIYTNYLQ